MRSLRVTCLTLALCLAFLLLPASWAQTTTLLSGTVSELDDKEEYPLYQARVELKALDGGSKFHASTDIKGRYAFNDLKPGDYEIRVTADDKVFIQVTGDGDRSSRKIRIKGEPSRMDIVVKFPE